MRNCTSDDRHPEVRAAGQTSNRLGLMVRRRAIAGAACVYLAAMRAVSNHGGKFGLAAILRDALAPLGLLRMRSEGLCPLKSLQCGMRSLDRLRPRSRRSLFRG